MGFQVACPNCGPRPFHEFWFGGELRPHDLDLSDEEDYCTTWFRTNAAGPQQERWFHYAGCRRWLTVERDTRDNSISVGQRDDRVHGPTHHHVTMSDASVRKA